ncbi:MAG: NAD(P)-dependent oxidoreductase [Flavobacteriaceae bacterium]|nr:NAD(P)-dependent oxidoreductase [Flavobacteriaceae bacterium]
MNKIGIIGCGWLGLNLAKVLIKKKFEVIATKTSEKGILKLNKFKIKGIIFKIDNGKIIGEIDFFKKIDQLIISIPPSIKNYDKSIETLFQLVNENINIKKTHFLSSISVYGKNGNEIFENSQISPETKNAKLLSYAEKKFLNLNSSLSIIRLGGLIGCDRHPIFSLINKKINNPKGYINFIHKTDAIKLIIYLIKTPKINGIINCVSPFHTNRKKYYIEIAKKLNLKKPVFNNKEKNLRKINSNKINLKKLFNYPVDNLLIDFNK